MGLHGLLLFFLREHHCLGYTNSDSYADSNSDPNPYANSDTYTHSIADSKPNAYADTRTGHQRRESHYLCATGKPQL
jgi:hypothetical protein